MTWLYGPLHEHVDSVPPPKIASTQDRLDLVDLSHTKSILKHRTISEMLTTPGRSASPTVDRNFEEEDEDEDEAARESRLRRGTIFPVRSDSNIQSRGPVRKRGSPPITPSEHLLSHPSLGNRTDSTASSVEQEKRHISFNQRVEQCISIDIDEREYDDEDDEDDDEDRDDYDDELNGGSSDEDGNQRDGDSSEDDDEQILTMKASPRMSPSLPMTTTSSLSSRNSSPGPVDHHTIAKLAPTLLKTTGNFPSPSPAVVDPSGIGGNQSHSPSPPSSSPAATPGTGKGPKSNSSSGGHINPANMFDTPNQEEAPPNPQGSGHVKQWDDDEEFSSNTFDYFNGPDMGGDYELDHASSSSNQYNRKNLSSESGGLEATSPENGRSGWISPGSSSGSSSNGGSQSTATSNPISTTTNATTSSTRDSDEIPMKTGATFSLGSPPKGNGGPPLSLPRSILKRRTSGSNSHELNSNMDEDGDVDILSTHPSSNESRLSNSLGVKAESLNDPAAALASSSSDSLDSSGGGDRERGRSSQRLGSSASYERLQEAASKSSGGVGAGSSGTSRGRSGSSGSNGNSTSPSASPYGSYEQISQAQSSASKGSAPGSYKNSAGSNRRKPSPQQGNHVGSPPNSPPSNQQAGKFRPQERRDSFRDGERPVGLGPTSNSTGSKSEKKTAGVLNNGGGGQDQDDGGAFDSSDDDAEVASHGPAGKDEVELRREQNQQKAKLASKKGKSAATGNKGSTRSSIDSNRSLESSILLPENPLNIDTSNVPPNQNANQDPSGLNFGGSPAQLPGPTPLNTPTLALAKSRSQRKKAAGKNKASSNGRVREEEEEDEEDDLGGEGSSSSNPSSPTVPRRQSATGALVAPTHSGDLPRIPLADDYVDEDEGGIIGRAVEIVNTARDLIGALLGSGGAGGRSWREGGM